jgi:hypothetical protein
MSWQDRHFMFERLGKLEHVFIFNDIYILHNVLLLFSPRPWYLNKTPQKNRQAPRLPQQTQECQL